MSDTPTAIFAGHAPAGQATGLGRPADAAGRLRARGSPGIRQVCPMFDF